MQSWYYLVIKKLSSIFIIVCVVVVLASATSAHAQSILDAFFPDVPTTNTPTQPAQIVPPTLGSEGSIDLLYDADSYVPPFYTGRALASAGTRITLESIVRFKKPIPSSDIIYTWKQDGRVLGSLSGRGRSSLVVPSPTLHPSITIELEAHSIDNASFASARVLIPQSDAILLLYQNNPLIGITFFHALSKDSSINENEMTFTAVPFFSAIASTNDARLRYAWTINDAPIAPNKSNPSELTLNATNSTGDARVALALQDSRNIFMDMGETWNIHLGTKGRTDFGAPALSPDVFGTQH
jgi:hypothetical protein